MLRRRARSSDRMDIVALKQWHASVVDAAVMRAAKPYAAPAILHTRSGSFRLACVGLPERVEYQPCSAARADAPKQQQPSTSKPPRAVAGHSAVARGTAAAENAARAADAVGISAETLLRMVVQQVALAPCA